MVKSLSQLSGLSELDNVGGSSPKLYLVRILMGRLECLQQLVLRILNRPTVESLERMDFDDACEDRMMMNGAGRVWLMTCISHRFVAGFWKRNGDGSKWG